MATRTTNLNLILPANNEYFNTWNQPLNNNLTIIDQVVGDLRTEVVEARGSSTSLADRLDAGLAPDGSPLASTEIVAARVSTIYGGFNTDSTAFDLNDRVEQGDRETFAARQSLTTMVDALAWGADQNKDNSVVTSATNYLTFTGAVVSLNGSVTPLVANINGYRQEVRTIKTTTISGAAATYYITLSKVAGGEQYLNIVDTSGVTSTYAATGLIAKLTGTTNFVTTGVKPGDVLEITGLPGNPNLGSYVVYKTFVEDAVDLAGPNELAITGQFVTASTGLNYALSNPIAPQLSFTGTAHAKSFTRVADTIYVGRCVFDGANVTSLTTYASLGKYADFTSVTLTLGDFSLTIPHNLGYFPSRVHIYASQANDFSQPIELLSSAEITGGGSLQRSVITQVNDTTLSVKNATNGIFYKDFGGTSRTSGYVYAVVER